MIKNSFVSLQPVKIHAIEECGSHSRILSYKRPYDFKAGQVVSITNSAEVPPRMYSIASGEDEKHIKILYKSVSDGVLTPRLDQLSPGDSILVSKPFGKFLGTDGPAVFVAAGTGVAPFMSMLRSCPHANKTLIHGSREKSEFYDAAFFTELLGDRYIRCFSGEVAHTLYSGRVTDYLKKMKILETDYKYYLCGSAEMVVEVRQILITRGIPFRNILSEIYF